MVAPAKWSRTEKNTRSQALSGPGKDPGGCVGKEFRASFQNNSGYITRTVRVLRAVESGRLRCLILDGPKRGKETWVNPEDLIALEPTTEGPRP